MASVSSSVIPPKEKYDVFLSFRGEDTRQTFTSHLHAALIRRKVATYIDYRLERGDEVGAALLKAIEESKISVIIFSKDYASSTWCLDELAYILECKETRGQHVIPIFYEIDPSQVRYQTGSYETAFAQHEQRLKDNTDKVPKWKEALVKLANLMPFANHERRFDKVAKWKEALVKAANISGFDSASRTVRDDSDLVEQVVRDVLTKLNRESSSYLTGLIGAEDRIKKILLELDIIPEDVRVRSVVIWGMGGIGKTTLADAVYHGLSSQFDAHCFLANVRERSRTKGAFSPELYDLRNELLGELLGDSSLAIRTRTIGGVYKERLRRAKVLVVLDDVNHSSQLTFLVGEVPFGPGSRIIITTRDVLPVKETLAVEEVANHDVKIYKAEELNGVESLQLFHLHGPIHHTAIKEANFYSFSHFLKKVVDHAAGIPLAINILRSLFLQWKEEPELLWDKLKKFPNKQLQDVYRVSFDGLERNEKEIFLDIACFHKRKKLCDAKRIIAACGLFPNNGIEILTDMSLISIKDGRIRMHDVIQEMGWEIIRKECTEDPGKRSRLYTLEDVYHVLERNKGTAAVQCISLKMVENEKGTAAVQCTSLKMVENEKVLLSPKAFTEMYNLRFLELGSVDINLEDNTDLECLPDALGFISWPRCPLKSLPSNFSPKNLAELHMPWSKLQRLWNKGQNPKSLRRIDLCGSLELTEVPDLSKCVNIESINLKGCSSLVEITSDFRNLTKLTYLNLRGCSKMRVIPELPCMVEFLDLHETVLEELPSSIWSMEKLVELSLHSYRGNIPNVPWNLKSLTSLVLTGASIERVPPSIEYLSAVVLIKLRGCKSLVSIPSTVCKLKSLEKLDLSSCTRFKNFPEILETMERLEYLCLYRTVIEQLPSSIGNLIGLKTLDLTWCSSLEFVPDGIYKLHLLEHFLLPHCRKLKKLPLSSTSLCKLICLDLDDCKLLEEIPDGLISSTSLKSLNLCGNRMIVTIPETIKLASGLRYLSIKNCKRLQSLPELPCHLKELNADGCIALKTVSRTEQKQHPDKGLVSEKHTFCGCINLDGNARRNIMEDAQIRTRRMAASDCENLDNNARSNIMEDGRIRTRRMAASDRENLDDNARSNIMEDGQIRTRRMAASDRENLDDNARSNIMEDGQIRTRRMAASDRVNLDDNARSNIMEDALIRTWRMAASERVNLDDNARSKIMEDALIRTWRMAASDRVNLDDNARSNIIEDAQIRKRRMAASHPYHGLGGRSLACIVMCPGNEIPRWFSCQTQGSSINIKLPLHWSRSNFLGFALCVVVTIHKSSFLRTHCKSIFTTNNGERHPVRFSFDSFWVGVLGAENSDHILVSYTNRNKLSDKAKSSTEASFDFSIELDQFLSREIDPSKLITVERCGVSFLYGQGQHDDALKFEIIHPQQDAAAEEAKKGEPAEKSDDVMGFSLFD